MVDAIVSESLMEPILYVVMAVLSAITVWALCSRSYWINQSNGNHKLWGICVQERDKIYDRARVAEQRYDDLKRFIGSFKDAR